MSGWVNRWTRPSLTGPARGAFGPRIPPPARRAVHLHRLRAGLPAARHGEIPLLTAVPVGLPVLDRQPCLVLHPCARLVQVSDAWRGGPPSADNDNGRAGAL